MSGRTRSQSAPAVAPEPAIVLSVRITDGSFESTVSVPVKASAAEKKAATLRWLEIMQFGLKQHGSDVVIRTDTGLKGDTP